MNMTGRLGVTKDDALKMLRDGWFIESGFNGAWLVKQDERPYQRRHKPLNASSFSSLIKRGLVQKAIPYSYPAVWQLSPEGQGP